jgi:hypothetical protein
VRATPLNSNKVVGCRYYSSGLGGDVSLLATIPYETLSCKCVRLRWRAAAAVARARAHARARACGAPQQGRQQRVLAG